MSIAVVGASSSLARNALEQVAQNVSPREFTLITCNPAKLAAWADRGAVIVEGAATDPGLLAQAFRGTLLAAGTDHVRSRTQSGMTN